MTPITSNATQQEAITPYASASTSAGRWHPIAPATPTNGQVDIEAAQTVAQPIVAVDVSDETQMFGREHPPHTFSGGRHKPASASSPARGKLLTLPPSPSPSPSPKRKTLSSLLIDLHQLLRETIDEQTEISCHARDGVAQSAKAAYKKGVTSAEETYDAGVMTAVADIASGVIQIAGALESFRQNYTTTRANNRLQNEITRAQAPAEASAEKVSTTQKKYDELHADWDAHQPAPQKNEPILAVSVSDAPSPAPVDASAPPEAEIQLVQKREEPKDVWDEATMKSKKEQLEKKQQELDKAKKDDAAEQAKADDITRRCEQKQHSNDLAAQRKVNPSQVGMALSDLIKGCVRLEAELKEEKAKIAAAKQKLIESKGQVYQQNQQAALDQERRLDQLGQELDKLLSSLYELVAQSEMEIVRG